jgi:hypothetical protein
MNCKLKIMLFKILITKDKDNIIPSSEIINFHKKEP